MKSLKTPKDPRRVIAFFSLASILTVGGILLDESLETYEQELSVLERNMESQATLLAEHAQLSFDMAERILYDVEWENQHNSLLSFLSSRPLYERIISTPQFAGLIVSDQYGEAFFSAKKLPFLIEDITNTDFFQANEEGKTTFIGHPLRLGSASRRMIPVSHRLVDPIGYFSGAAVVFVDTAYFQAFYNDVIETPGLRIGMFSKDGTVLSLYPVPDAIFSSSRQDMVTLIGQKFADTLIHTSPIDGTKRITAYRNLETAPLAVTVSYDYDAFLSHVKLSFFRNGIVFVLFLSGVGFAFFYLNSLVKARTRLTQKLTHMASTDSLMGIANRREFDRVLDQEWQRCAREGKEISLLLIDVDFFKRFNDTYGHPEGDKTLKNIAEILKTIVRRPSDLAARYGGEEMAVLLPNTTFSGAEHVAQRIHSLLAERALPFEASPLISRVTVSIGISSLLPAAHSSSSLVKQADEALYQAKESGRNRTEAY